MASRSLKGLVALVAGAMLGLAITAVTPAFGAEYSEGYRMGELSKLSVKGVLSKTGEGELLMGNDSAPWVVTDGEQRIVKNPWAFSADAKAAQRYQHMVGEYVIVHYREIMMNMNPLGGDTNYRLISVRPVDRSQIVSPCAASAGGSKSSGQRVGRIVKVSQKGAISKTNEVTMQVGNAGGQFLDMSVSDPVLYACARNWLFSGRKVKVTYRQSFFRNPLGADTTYQIVKIEPVKTLED